MHICYFLFHYFVFTIFFAILLSLFWTKILPAVDVDLPGNPIPFTTAGLLSMIFNKAKFTYHIDIVYPPPYDRRGASDGDAADRH